MALTLKVQPGYQFSENERMDRVKLNQLGRPTIDLIGTVSGAAIGEGSIGGSKLSPTLISDLTPGEPETEDLIMFQDIDGGRLANTTIGRMLELSTPELALVTNVTLADFAWIIQSDGNKKATIADMLREAVNGQTELVNPGDIDPVKDMLLVYDDNGLANSNKNRKTKVKTAVASVTNTLIADAPEFVGDMDQNADEILVRDASQASPNQQRRLKLKTLVARAWLNMDGTVPVTNVLCFFSAGADTVTTGTAVNPVAHNLNTGDYIWFESAHSGSGASPQLNPFYVFKVNDTSFQLYKTKAGAQSQDQAQRVDLIADASTQFQRWGGAIPSNPIRASNNISAVLRTADEGRYRVFFESPMPDASYAVQVTGSDDAARSGTIAAVRTREALPGTGSFDISTMDDDGIEENAKYISILVMR